MSHINDSGTQKLAHVVIKSDSIQVDEILLEHITPEYWSTRSLANLFEKYKCESVLEHYGRDILLCKFTLNDYRNYQFALETLRLL